MNTIKETPVDWFLISTAIQYYQSIGYKYLEVPWTTSGLVATHHLGKAKTGLFSDNSLFGGEFIVSSGPQAFSQLLINKQIKYGNYVIAAPCFTLEEDQTHKSYFFTIDLINYQEDIKIDKCFNDAFDFFSCEAVVKTVEDEYYKHISLNNINIGSYSIQEFQGELWAHGTGLSEPTFSFAKNKRLLNEDRNRDKSWQKNNQCCVI